jgi:hypothetical protein
MELEEGDYIVAIWFAGAKDSDHDLMAIMLRRAGKVVVEIRLQTSFSVDPWDPESYKSFLEIGPNPLDQESTLIAQTDAVFGEAAEDFHLKAERIDIGGDFDVMLDKMRTVPWWHVKALMPAKGGQA